MAQIAKIGTHRTTVATVDGMTHVTYHQTAVVSFNHKKIILRSGGWKTVTTKGRMNQTSNQFDLGFGVFQKDYGWFVYFKGETLEFKDGMVLVR